MGADRVRPRTAAAQQRLATQQQPMKKRGAPSRYTSNGVNYQERSYPISQGPARTQKLQYEDPEYPEAEYKAGKHSRVQSADLLAKLKMSSLKKYCYVHNIDIDDQPPKDQLLHAIHRHWKHQVVDDKVILKKFAYALSEKADLSARD